MDRSSVDESRGSAAGPNPDLSGWAIEPEVVERTRWGYTNETWFVATRAGQYVLRLYTSTDEDAIRAEHMLLRALAAEPLPFAVPEPLARRDGSTFAAISTGSGKRIAALFPRIAGEHLDDADTNGVEAAGAAFAQLDVVLARHGHRARFDGELTLVSDAAPRLDELDELPVEAQRFVDKMSGAPSHLRATLEPRQLIHGDFGFGNVLTVESHITGVLDWEYAVIDARAAELATALRLVLSKGTADVLWKPLLRGYLSQLPLTPAEIEALPALTLHQEAVLLVWSLGRARRGLMPWPRIAQNAQRAKRLDDWIADNAHALVSEALVYAARAG